MMRRHVYYYTLLPHPDEVLSPLLSGDPALWLPEPAAAEGDEWRVRLSAEGALPEGLAGHDALVSLGTATTTNGGLLRPVEWRSATADRFVPVLTGDLELTPLNGSGCHLALMATYRPPLAVVGGVGDRLVGHRVAEASVRRFILDVADRIGEELDVTARG